VLAGFSIPKGATKENRSQAAALIDYLTRPEVQIETLKQNYFFPVIDIKLPDDLSPGLKMIAATITRQANAPFAITTLLPVGLGGRGGDFNKVYIDTFTRIILRNQDITSALDTEAANLRRIMQETRAPCWAPDPVSEGPCPVN
jgi:multiple sugar transport system substrate-binding protein